MNLRNKSKNLKEKILKDEEEKKSKKSGKGDKRFLNYFDLDFGEKVTIRLLPDGGDSGDYWAEYEVHGGGLKLRGANNINCSYASSGEDCPVCQHSYSYFTDGNKDEAARWRSNNKFLAQCIVIDSPFEVNESEDGNPIKLINLPFKVYEILKEAVIEDQVGDIMDTDFIIKKTKNSGGQAAYDKSFFAKKEEPLGDEIFEAFESGELKLYNLFDETPTATTTADMDEWLDKTIALDNKASRRSTSSRSSNDDDSDSGEDDNKDDDSTPKKSSASSLLDRLKNKDKNKE